MIRCISGRVCFASWHSTWIWQFRCVLGGFSSGTRERTHLPMQEMLETGVQSLGREDPLEEGMATHSSFLASRISMDRGAWWAIAHEVAEADTTVVIYYARTP